MSYLSLDVYHGSKNLDIFSDKSKRIDLFKQVTRFVVVPALKSFPDNFDWISVSGLFLPSTSPHFPKCLIVVVSFLPWYVIYRFSYVFHVAPRIIVDINFWLRKNENILHNCYRPLRCWRFCLFQKSCWGSSDFIATTFFNVRWNYIFIFTAIFVLFYFIFNERESGELVVFVDSLLLGSGRGLRSVVWKEDRAMYKSLSGVVHKPLCSIRQIEIIYSVERVIHPSNNRVRIAFVANFSRFFQCERKGLPFVFGILFFCRLQV